MESLSHNRLKQIAKYYNVHTQIKRYTVISKDELIAELKKHLEVSPEGKLVYKSKTPLNLPLKEKKPRKARATKNLFKEPEPAPVPVPAPAPEPAKNENKMKDEPKEEKKSSAKEYFQNQKEEEEAKAKFQKEMEEEQPELDEITEEDKEDYKKQLDYYSENSKEFLDVPSGAKKTLMLYWKELGFKIPKTLKDVYEGKTVKGKGKPKKNSKVCMPKDEYLAEHKHLNHLLSHPTKSGLKKEYKKQMAEVKMRGGAFLTPEILKSAQNYYFRNVKPADDIFDEWKRQLGALYLEFGKDMQRKLSTGREIDKDKYTPDELAIINKRFERLNRLEGNDKIHKDQMYKGNLGLGKPRYALHAVIIHKPYPLEKAKQDARHIMKTKNPKFMRETINSYRFRNIPKTKFNPKSYRTQVVNPNISLIWGVLN